MPIFSSDTILFSIEKRLNNENINDKNINKEDFLKYLQKKYPIFNFTQEQIEAVSTKASSNSANWCSILLKVPSSNDSYNIGKRTCSSLKIIVWILKYTLLLNLLKSSKSKGFDCNTLIVFFIF